MIRKGVSLVALVSLVMLIPAAALAQTGIAGGVKDTTGAVLPGVTVEASSPALIEKVRTVVSDDQGLYKIVDLRPGVYTVTFTLPGFAAVRREGIELTSNFTATVNAEMRVGGLDETITVSGQSPVVDVQNVVQRRAITQELVAALPTARTFQTLAAGIPGITVTAGVSHSGQDVGGSMGDQSQSLMIHGSRSGDAQNMIDGMPMNGTGSATQHGNFMDMGSLQEVSYELGAVSAETTSGGVHVNFIPKEGGNLFAGTVFGAFTNHSLQSDNVTDELRARGLPAANRIDKIWDVNISVGGPIKRDTLWFYVSTRYWGLNELTAGMWYDKNPLDVVYTPDLSRQAIDDSWLGSGSARLTWQLTPKHKLTLFDIHQGRCLCHNGVSATISPEASVNSRTILNYTDQVTWTAPVTNRLLLQAGMMFYRQNHAFQPQPEVFGRDDIVSLDELSTGLNFRAPKRGYSLMKHWVYNYRGSVTYVTGSHAAKVGFTLQSGKGSNFQNYNGDINLQLLNGVPRSVVVYATPYTNLQNLNAALGIYAQDQWTIRRVTLNLAVRLDYHNTSVPEQHLPPVRFVPARDFAAVSDVPNWTDLSPRLGAAYDLFGTGRTALKVTLNRYVAGAAAEFARANNPVNTSVNSATRTWTDLNGNFNPDCDFLNPAANAECGALSDANFGKVRVTTRYDDAVRQGFGSRGYNWETSAGIQHELVPQVAVNATYFRRWYGNFTVTDNLAVTPADYDPYCITAPVDARLPGGGGNQVCGFYDINPAKFGQVNNLVAFVSNYGKQTDIYDGVDLTMNARLPHGALIAGGINIGRTKTNTCFVVDSPQLQFCDVKPPFQSQVRLQGSYPFPWGLQAAATFQSIPGPAITATYVATNAQISPSLGRNLASGANGTATVELVQPGTRYEERTSQVDVRLSKIFEVGRTRIQGNFDLYNLLNASPVNSLNLRYGPAWLRPTYILPGRLLKFGGQVNF